MLKHLSKNTLKMVQKDLLFSKKTVIYPANSVRRSHNNDGTTKRTNDNIEDREDKCAVQIGSKYVYRIPLKYFYNLSKINFPTKIDLNIRCILKTEMKRLFESKMKVTTIGSPNAQIVFLKVPFLQCEQILLTKNLETILLSSKVLIMGIQKTRYQKTYELQTELQEFMVDFKGCERQFDLLEISLIYNKTDKHLIIYDSYNTKCAAKMMKSIKLGNISGVHSATKTMKFDTLNDNQKKIRGNNTLRSIAKDIVPLQFPTTSTTPF